ncbi:hypothetical protein DYB37_006116 [Aphanomyces astaci]|uniref:Nodulin-like domain-containing protein n=1 Tax=Aphanomyces astaci TaxID=112090 RepID=A0A418FKI6_APHAT|nr:hypothetical protein DYB37_006116 [Aphanomyces astaci]
MPASRLTARWRARLSLAVSSCLMLCVGSSYAISAWNSQLKELLSLDQSQITTVNSSLSFGLYLALLPGIFYDLYGARATTAVAGVLMPILFLSAYAQSSTTASSSNGPPSVALLAITFGLIGLLSQFAGIACITANEGNFGAAHRGKVLGFLFSCFSAGGAVFAYIYRTYFDQRVADYFMFMAGLTVVVCALGAVFIHANPTKTTSHPPSSESESLLPTTKPSSSSSASITGFTLLRDSRFWYLFVPTMIGVGSGLLVNANLAFIVQARLGSPALVPTLVSVFSICNVGGRVTIGWVSDASVGILSRGHFLSGGLALMAAAHLSFLWGSLDSLYVSVAAAGIAEGCLFPTYSVLTRELFGAAHFGKNFGYMTLANAIGFPLILGPLASALYHVTATSSPSGVEICQGPSCFNPTFLICAALNAVSLCGSVQLHA